MKSILTSLGAISLLATMAFGQTRYKVTDLGLAGNAPGQPFHITNNGQIAGSVGVTANTWHAVLWDKAAHMTDIGTAGLGGPSSVTFWINEQGQAVGQAETKFTDQNGEDFCGFGSQLLCLPFLWQEGKMTALPTLAAGKSGLANSINNGGEAAGTSEKATADITCPPFDPSMLQFQKYQFKPVIWGKDATIQELPTAGGDPDGIAFAINDSGQVAGGTGTCTAFQAMGNLTYLFGQHAVLWQDGKAIDLGNLGGVSPLSGGNDALGINNQGQVVGVSGLADNTTFHGFIWSKQSGIKDLGTVPGDVDSVGVSLNDSGEVVGLSFPANGPPRAFIRQKNALVDLNSLIPVNSSLYLMLACSINSIGEIIGLAFDSDGNAHGYLLTPTSTTAVAGPKDTAVTQKSIQLDGTQSTSADGLPLTYSWTIPQGYPSAAISGGSTATPTVQFPLTRGSYMFRLAVTDAAGNSSTDTVEVNYMGN